MSRIKLVADSGCDLEIEYFEKYNIELAPLKVHLDGEANMDVLDIKSSDMYRLMKEEGKVFSTSQATPADFIDIFTRIFEDGYDSIIYIAFSSNLSGTYQSSLIAKEEFEGKDIVIIDSKCASLGYGLVVLKVARMLQGGASKQEIVAEIERKSKNMEHIFTVDDLKYLQKGGRISFAKAMLGTMLNLKPVMHVEDGKLFAFGKAKGKKKVLNEMLKTMKDRITDTNETVGICDAADRETAMELDEMIRKEFPQIKEIIHTNMGGVIGSHTGPGCISLYFEGQHEFISI